MTLMSIYGHLQTFTNMYYQHIYTLVVFNSVVSLMYHTDTTDNQICTSLRHLGSYYLHKHS